MREKCEKEQPKSDNSENFSLTSENEKLHAPATSGIGEIPSISSGFWTLRQNYFIIKSFMREFEERPSLLFHRVKNVRRTQIQTPFRQRKKARKVGYLRDFFGVFGKSLPRFWERKNGTFPRFQKENHRLIENKKAFIFDETSFKFDKKTQNSRKRLFKRRISTVFA